MLSTAIFLLLSGAIGVMQSVRAQGGIQPHAFPRAGAQFDAGETEYFLLFPGWTEGGGAIPRHPVVQVEPTVGDSVRLTWEGSSAPSILISDRAARALDFYLEHFEALRQETDRTFLLASDGVPVTLHPGMNELFDQQVIPRWWPGWSRGEGENLVQVRLKDGGSLRGRILGMTDRRLLVWRDSVPFTAADIPECLYSLRWADIDAIFVPDERSSELGWAGMVTLLTMANLGPNRHREDDDGLASFLTNLGRVLVIGLGALGFLISDDIITEYQPGSSSDPYEVVTSSGSPLRDARLLQPGLPPEIAALIDTAEGERLLSGSDLLPLRRIPPADETIMPYGVWAGMEQIWLGHTQDMGFRTGLAAGYVLPLKDLDPERIRLGLDFIASGYRDFGSAGIRGFLQVHWLRIGAGIRAVLLGESLHTTTNDWSKWGDSHGGTTVLYQHASTPLHYLYADFGFDFALRKMSIGVHRLMQFSPSAYTIEDWHSYSRVYGTESGRTIISGLRLDSWAVSLQVWL